MASKRKRQGAAAINDRQEVFVREYLVHLNASKAAAAAGYTHPDRQGYRLLSNVRVQKKIEAAQAKIRTKLDITADDIARELQKCGFANMLDYMKGGEDGDPYLDFSQLTRDQAAALSEVTVEDFKDGRGEDARDVKRVKFRLVDKRAALMDLAKLLGFLKERHEHTGKDGAPIEIKSGVDLAALSPDDRTRLRALLRAAVLAPKHTNGHAAGAH